VTQAGREGWILLRGVSHEIVAPRDPQSGLATGRRRHHPFRIIKELDKSSPLLYNALVNNENLTKIEIKFFSPQTANDRTTGRGVEAQHYTICMTNANINRADFRMANNRIGDNSRLPEFEEYEFTYQKITWTWTDGGITAEDDWETPLV
jgi:type VI secretion system secreted protein Hcp